MATFRINGTTIVDVYVEVEAETLEEAIEIADEHYHIEEYCNNTIGVEDNSYELPEGEIVSNGWIEWHEEYSEEV